MKHIRCICTIKRYFLGAYNINFGVLFYSGVTVLGCKSICVTRSGGICLRNFIGTLAPLFLCFDTNKGEKLIKPNCLYANCFSIVGCEIFSQLLLFLLFNFSKVEMFNNKLSKHFVSPIL
jgi:hypothetical protein